MIVFEIAARKIKDRTFCKQNDKRWQGVKMGGIHCPKETIGTHGCLLTVIYNILKDHQKEIKSSNPNIVNIHSPADFLRFLRENGCISESNDMNVDSAAELFGCCVSEIEISLSEIKHQLNQNVELIGQMKIGECDHYYRVIDVTRDDKYVIIDDPLGRYKKIKISQITRLRRIQPGKGKSDSFRGRGGVPKSYDNSFKTNIRNNLKEVYNSRAILNTAKFSVASACGSTLAKTIKGEYKNGWEAAKGFGADTSKQIIGGMFCKTSDAIIKAGTKTFFNAPLKRIPVTGLALTGVGLGIGIYDTLTDHKLTRKEKIKGCGKVVGKTAVEIGFTIVCQSVIPIPVVGAFIGGFIGCFISGLFW